ncbi:putative LRR receptor-like serine/threonine-protein kinase [Camellia lanceoleosa]|uniref:LRR receptor-like serine/threonine-protein kinase n=1 Tax=Camellia lanceoleosa TaxID=1840588 RepID=A0ACC0IJQ0_9ERIC|nr:putative LRR receptor-like serine/threonine-protein kinase [Camellia lanceoleosa]
MIVSDTPVAYEDDIILELIRLQTMNLKDLCLEGTLTPELGKLTYIKLMGNFSVEIGELKELEVLDLGYNFSGPFPSNFSNNMSLSILLLDNNNFNISPELCELQMLFEFQVDENQLTSAALRLVATADLVLGKYVKM